MLINNIHEPGLERCIILITKRTKIDNDTKKMGKEKMRYRVSARLIDATGALVLVKQNDKRKWKRAPSGVHVCQSASMQFDALACPSP